MSAVTVIFLPPGRTERLGRRQQVSEPPVGGYSTRTRRRVGEGRGGGRLISGRTCDHLHVQSENSAALTSHQQTRRFKTQPSTQVHTAERVPKLTRDFLFWELTGLSHCGVTQALRSATVLVVTAAVQPSLSPQPESRLPLPCSPGARAAPELAAKPSSQRNSLLSFG